MGQLLQPQENCQERLLLKMGQMSCMAMHATHSKSPVSHIFSVWGPQCE